MDCLARIPVGLINFYISAQMLHLFPLEPCRLGYSSSGVKKHRLVCKKREGSFLLVLSALLGQENGVDVGQNTSAGDGDATEQAVQLLVVADGELNVARDNARALVVAGGVSGQLENLGRQVLKDGGQVHGGTGSDAVGVASLAQVAVDTSCD